MKHPNPIAKTDALIVANAPLGLLRCQFCGEEEWIPNPPPGLSRRVELVEVELNWLHEKHGRCWLKKVAFA